ncbi:MAG: hypothetical protein A3A82_00340 [Candidatus Pacebacteria bacterium RIFCSPLOWO2_01_FULL_47_12]|nr:MAG: hypothetical protein A3J60_03375 [Candidatus Pacebacteria bacterium RIFCSPHIGHO2_02_FULL_46_9]OGJ39238.1 MAG: hypothetical protein A3A82_00340 [Candidatus Pacebacteria bacterium RIFCSPLOWO2_01_FULL_47_12]
MLRTQVLITPDQKLQLEYYTQSLQVSGSALIRKALDTYIDILQKKSNTTTQLLHRANQAKGGAPTDLSTNDEYLYEV